MIDKERVRKTLKDVQDPELKKSLVDLGMIRNIKVADDNKVSLTLALTTLKCPRQAGMVREIKDVLAKKLGVGEVEVAVTALSAEERQRLFPQHPLLGIKKVKNFLAVASGKGGVGKTTVAINLALALRERGHRVGLLDADVYGPSVPLMLGLSGKPEVEDKMLIPVEKFGLKIISFGMLMKEGEAVIWRGPLVARAINQLLGEVMWGELDYLVVDLPPGTGDPSITIAKALPSVLAVMVTTPQEVALADVRRSVALFQKIDRGIVGFVENMSYFICSHSRQPINIFGRGGGERLSRETGLPLLGAIPIDMEISGGGDSGTPLMCSAPDSEAARTFLAIAEKIENRGRK